jgi:hypothetical protein
MWRVLGHGYRGSLAPVRLGLFDLLGKPARLRRWLASDLDRVWADIKEPPSTEEGDLVADGLWHGLISGWSVDEEAGRWTDGPEAVLCWANKSRGRAPL